MHTYVIIIYHPSDTYLLHNHASKTQYIYLSSTLAAFTVISSVNKAHNLENGSMGLHHLLFTSCESIEGTSCSIQSTSGKKMEGSIDQEKSKIYYIKCFECVYKNVSATEEHPYSQKITIDCTNILSWLYAKCCCTLYIAMLV